MVHDYESTWLYDVTRAKLSTARQNLDVRHMIYGPGPG